MTNKEIIENGQAVVGIEFGSTRIKSVMIDDKGNILASGDFTWENSLVDGIWTYDIELIHKGLRESYGNLVKDVNEKYGVTLKKIKSLGISAMMHGYLAFDKDDNLLVPFRTWRNTITGEAAGKLTDEFGFNIPERWSISHLYQAILNKEAHVKDIAYFTTLAGYIHYKLTGKKVLGVGDASGMFPIDSKTKNYNEDMLSKFRNMISSEGFNWDIKDILPEVLLAGDNAGTLTESGAAFLDVTGNLEAGSLLAPPEGDAGTGMTATGSVKVRTGNVSAGTSVFAMVVLENPVKELHREIDIVTTPCGDDVAMVHCNNCTSDINAWANIFAGFLKAAGKDVDMNEVYTTMFKSALGADKDCSGVISYNYFSGEQITGLLSGRPMVVRKENANFSFENFMRANLYSAVASLKIGLDILTIDEGVTIDKMIGHGGFFKTPGVGNRIMAAAMNSAVTTLKTAGEGGPWGMALLAAYSSLKEEGKFNGSLDEFLYGEIFSEGDGETVEPDAADVKGFNDFMKDYKAGIAVEKCAVDTL